MSKNIITCRNKNLKKRSDHTFDLRGGDLDAGCSNCFFIKTHRGDHWLDDWAHCTVGISVKYGDKIEAKAATNKIIKKKAKD